MPNSITLDGRLGRDPEKRGNDNGPVTFSICHSKNRKTPTGEWESEPHWFDVIVWGKTRERALGLRKGERVLVTGRLETSKWEAQDGSKRTSVQVVADIVASVPAGPVAEETDW